MTDTITKLVEILQKLFSFLRWKHVGLIVAMGAMFILGTAFWENRPTIYNAITASKFSSGTMGAISETTKFTIKHVVDKAPTIVGLQVVSTDFRNNTRDTVYFYADDPGLQREFNDSVQTKVIQTPLFVQADKANNDRLIGIIEQEFVCTDTPPKLLSFVPNSAKFAKTVCSISVPPRYGRMVGYVNILLNEALDRDLLPEYKQIARAMSDEIYDRDVVGIIK